MPTHFQENEPSEGLAYIDVLARELASESCVRCSRGLPWETAALIYEGLEWKYYYCYQCRRWFRRHYRYRYAVALVDDRNVIDVLVRYIESQKQVSDAELETATWVRRKFSAAGNFFQRFLP